MGSSLTRGCSRHTYNEPMLSHVLPLLDARDRRPELMDQPGLDEPRHRAALDGLRRVNWISGTSRRLWKAIRPVALRFARPLSVLDVACGGGDVAVNLWKHAAAERFSVEFGGCDVSPGAVTHARDLARRADVPVTFFEWDALSGSLPAGRDVLLCTLFLHHLEHDAAVDLLRRMAEAAGSLVIVDDLCRSRLGYTIAWTGTRLLSRSRIVHYDGPASVEAAFTPAEALQLAEDAGLRGAQIQRHWPERYLLTWEKR